jgi:hypothetical protein
MRRLVGVFEIGTVAELDAATDQQGAGVRH